MRSPRFTVYLDECVNHKVVPYLRARGITARTTRDEAMSGADDDAQLRFAHTKKWIILTNNRGHFLRQHRDFLARSEPHSGIVAVPQDDALPERFFVRSGMMLAWLMVQDMETANQLFRWVDLQRGLQQGYRLPRFTYDEVALALGLPRAAQPD